MSTAQNMGGTGTIPIKNQTPDGTFTSVSHTVGRWKTTMVRPTVYKMRGFNSTTGQYEFWLTAIPSQGPPTGSTLSNIIISATWSDTFPTSE